MYEFGTQEIDAAVRVLRSGKLFRYLPGAAEADTFERALGRRLGAGHVVATASGTAAMICGLAALGVGPGDEVVVPAYGFVAGVLAPLAVGAVPVVCEIDESLTMDPADLACKLTSRTRAILPVHVHGSTADLDAICGVAAGRGLACVEDACQAIGATYHGRHVGTIGDAGAFSFNQHKILTAGEGGALVTSRGEIYERAFMTHDGSSSFSRHTFSQPQFAGLAFRLNEISAAILNAQLARLDEILAGLRDTSDRIAAALSAAAPLKPIPVPDPAGACGTHLGYLFEDAEQASLFHDAADGDEIGALRPIVLRPLVPGVGSAASPPWRASPAARPVAGHRLGPGRACMRAQPGHPAQDRARGVPAEGRRRCHRRAARPGCGGHAMTGQVRLGLAGAGRIVREGHAPAYLANRDLMTVAAIADPDKGAAALAADQLGVPGDRQYPALTDMLDAGGVDLVVVATPPDAHHDAVVESLCRGCGVICEKPLCLSLGELASIKTAASGGSFLSMMHNYLSSPGWHRLIGLVARGRIGRPVMVRIEELADDHWRLPGSSSTWLESAGRGGGPLRDNLYHPLYLAEQLLGSPVEAASGAQAALVHDYSAGDTAMMAVRHANGTLTQALAAWSFPGQSRAVAEVVGDEAVARYSYWVEPDWLEIDNGSDVERIGVPEWHENLDSGYVHAFREIVGRFAAGLTAPYDVAAAERIIRATTHVPAMRARLESRYA